MKWHLGNTANCARNHAVCEGARVIAVVVGTGYPIGTGWAPESEAKARLIAAAPDLLEALKNLVEEISLVTASEDGGLGGVKDARAAIAKATGAS